MSGPGRGLSGEVPDVSGYDWLTEESRVMVAGCVTVVTGASLALVADAFGVDLSQVVALGEPGDRGAGDSGTEQVVTMVESGGAVVVVEDDDAGSSPEVLEAASASGSAASVSWNAESEVSFSCARDGRVLYSEEILTGETAGLPDELLPLIALVADDIEDLGDEPGWVSIAAAMVERFTGLAITPAHLDVLDGYRVTDPPGG